MQNVFDAVRVAINDTFAGATATLGEGRIFTTSAADNWTPAITILNLALQHMGRDLENYGLPTTREVEFILGGLTPVNGPQGLGSPDPTTQVYLSFGGYWDGNILNPLVSLPYDLLVPLKIGQRITGSGVPFCPVPRLPDGLPSIDQTTGLGYWDWIGDSIWFNGSQNTMDIELRYTGGVPIFPTNIDPALYDTTLVPFLDCYEPLSYRMAYIFCMPRLPKGGADELQSNYEDGMLKMANRWIKTMQRVPSTRPAFESGGGPGGAGGAVGGWWTF